MMLRTLSAACATLFFLTPPGAALAADPVGAKLQRPVPARTTLIVGGAMFVCRDARCVATAPGSRTLAVATCRDLATAFGPVTAFGDRRRQLGQAKLGRCNAVTPVHAEIARR